MFFAVIDVLQMTSKMILIGPDEEKAATTSFPGKMVEPGVYDVGHKVSRKKDFIPALSKFFKPD